MTLPDRLLLADRSAWERAGDPRIRDEWAAALVSGRVVTCLPIRYELLFSTRDRAEFDALARSLAALRDVAVTASAQRTALAAMRDLAASRPLRHRLPLADLLIAAVALEHGLVVVHEDHHFERLQRVLRFDAQRLLP